MNVQFPGLGFSVDVNPVVFEIGGLSVHWYGVIIASGFLLAVIYALTSAKKFFLNSDKLFDAVLLGVVTGIVGARLYYVLFYPTVNGPNPYFQDPVKILYIWEGGLAIYGGVIGGLLGGILMAKIRKINILAMLDLGVLGFLIGQGIGRWGNFINQEAFGVETSLPWGMLSQNTIRAGFEGPVHPCFLYESLWCLLGFVLLHFFSRKWRQYDGQIFLLYLVWYGVERFVVEGLRTDSLYIPGLNLRVSQVLAAATALVGIVLLIVFRKRRKLEGCGYGRPAAVVVAEYDAAVKAEAEKQAAREKKEAAILCDPEEEPEKNAAEADEESGSEENAEEPSAGEEDLPAASGEAREAAPAETDESGPEA
mgnify:CR=1 FL=1